MLRYSLPFLKPIILSSAEALRDIRDGASIAVGGFGLCGVPFDLLRQLNENKTRNLTIVSGTMAGEECGLGPLAKAGQIKTAITSYIGENKVMTECFKRGDLEVEFCPMGSLVDRLRAGGAGIPAFFTPTGYGTAVAEGALPRRFSADGRVVAFTPPRETRCFKGRWCTLENAIETDFAFIKAWKSDPYGNLIFRGTTRNYNTAAATCAKVCIAEVEEIVESGAIDPNEVHLPGVYVHRIVQPTTIQKHVEFAITKGSMKNKTSALNGENNKQEKRIKIARRAVLEVQDGMQLNLGVGIPNLVAEYIPKNMDVLLQAENGLLGIGPYPSTLPDVDVDFTNAGKQSITIASKGASLFDSIQSFAMMRGGHLDMTMLGALEVSSHGDIASWMIPGKLLKGMGGAMDLAASGSRIVVLMEHTQSDNRTSRIVTQCSAPLTGKGVVETIITDLALFKVKKTKGTDWVGKLVLEEIAEGVTLEEVKEKTEAPFEVSSELKIMPLAPEV